MNARMVYLGLDVHKETITAALAHAEPPAQVESLGQILNRPEAIRRLIQGLQPRYRLSACYEAGPCGYTVYRQLRGLGVDCSVVAPSLVPIRPGDRVKTDRRDAVRLARLLRSGELTSVWVPDPPHEALRNLTRLRAIAHHDRTRARHRLSKFLLRSGHVPPAGMNPWSARHLAWAARLTFAQPLDRLVRDDYQTQVEFLQERVHRLDQAIESAVAASALAPRILAQRALRGVDTVTATTVIAEWGEIARFIGPRQLMGYTGLVPSESSSGEAVHRGPITKAGSSYLRRVLIEAAFAYRHRPFIGATLRQRQRGQPEAIQRISWKAQQRLHRLYRRLLGRGKRHQKVVVAVARELVGFMWAVDREVSQSPRLA